jgi:hypothetical protein
MREPVGNFTTKVMMDERSATYAPRLNHPSSLNIGQGLFHLTVVVASHIPKHFWSGGGGNGWRSRCLSPSGFVSIIDIARRSLDHVTIGVVAQMRAGARLAPRAWNEAGLLDGGEAGCRHLKDGSLGGRDAALPKAALAETTLSLAGGITDLAC